MNAFFREVNEINAVVTEGVISELEKLENMTVGEYYAHLETWTSLKKKQEKAIKDASSKNVANTKKIK